MDILVALDVVDVDDTLGDASRVISEVAPLWISFYLWRTWKPGFFFNRVLAPDALKSIL